MRYSVELTSVAPANLGQVAKWQNLELTPRLNGYLEGQVDIPQTDPIAASFDAALGIKVYRGSTLRAFGRITGIQDNKDWFTVNFADPFWWLQGRTWLHTPDQKYTSTDAGSIVSSVLATVNSDSPTRLVMGTIQASALRTIAISAGTQIDQFIDDLSQMSNGFYYRVDPVDNTSGQIGKLMILYPNSGSDKPGARFEFGDGTIGNLLPDWERDLAPGINHVKVWGTGSGDQQPHIVVEDSASETSHLRYSQEYSFNSKYAQHLTEFGNGKLHGAAYKTYRLNCVPRDPSSPDSEVWVPAPWDDFTIGDTVRLTIKHGRVQDVNLTARVQAFTVKVLDTSGAEQITDLNLEV